MRIATSKEQAEQMILELQQQNEAEDLAQEQIDANNKEIEELGKWL